jgi:hypothetical protein
MVEVTEPMKYDTEVCKCEICGSPAATTVWDKQTRKDNNVLGSVVITNDDGSVVHGRNVCCHGCGLVYVNPRMTKESLDKFYSEEYRKVYHKPEAEQEAEIRHANTVMQIIAVIGKPKTLLDVGAYHGKLVDLAWEHGIDAIGVECNPDIEHPHIVNADIEVWETDRRFQCITIINTLEHTYSPKAVLTKLASLLDDSGILIIAVPYLFNMNLRRNVDAYLSNAHLYNFSANTLEKLCIIAGLDVLGHHFVPEEIGNKLYFVCGKSKFKRENNFVVTPDVVADFLRVQQDLIDTSIKAGV